MLYTAGTDGALKFWRLHKIVDSKAPTFDRTKEDVTMIKCICGPNPEHSVVMTISAAPFLA